MTAAKCNSPEAAPETLLQLSTDAGDVVVDKVGLKNT